MKASQLAQQSQTLVDQGHGDRDVYFTGQQGAWPVGQIGLTKAEDAEQVPEGVTGEFISIRPVA